MTLTKSIQIHPNPSIFLGSPHQIPIPLLAAVPLPHRQASHCCHGAQRRGLRRRRRRGRRGRARGGRGGGGDRRGGGRGAGEDEVQGHGGGDGVQLRSKNKLQRKNFGHEFFFGVNLCHLYGALMNHHWLTDLGAWLNRWKITQKTHGGVVLRCAVRNASAWVDFG